MLARFIPSYICVKLGSFLMMMLRTNLIKLNFNNPNTFFSIFKFAVSEGLANCSDCVAGTYSSEGSSICSQCESGFSTNGATASFSCVSCVAGKVLA